MVHPVGFVLTIASAAASSLGWAIGSAGNVLIPDQLPARWVTIDGIIDSPSGPVTTGFVTQAIASALDTTLRLRTPRAPYAIIQPRDARVGESVIARTRESGACSGHRRFDKVIAAACTRLEAVAPQPVAQQPAARPPAPQQPLQPQPVAPRPAARPPAPRPAARPPAPSPVAPPQQYRPPAEAVSPWWYAVGAVAIAGAVVLITTKDSR
jgi:cell division septation protein DedD